MSNNMDIGTPGACENSMHTNGIPAIFQYQNYRDYLRDYYDYKKSIVSGFSYRTFSNKIGFKTKDFILRVIQGKRNVSAASATAIAKGIKLSKWEAQYFCALVQFNQATNAKARDEAHDAMQTVLKLARFKNEQHLLAHYQYEVYSKWFILAIRSLIGLQGFTGDYEQLAAQLHPPITASEAQYAVELLVKSKLLKQDDKGYHLIQDDITTGDTVRKAALKNYHQNCLKLASESIENDPANVRNISALTLGISQKSYDQIIQRLTEFRKEIALIASEDQDADRVVQINFQMFPLSK
jgi:uncharacterized protein (TIGR02147 family)